MPSLEVRVALAALFLATCASAQQPPPQVPYPNGLYLFPIVVEGQPHDLKLTLSKEEHGKPFLYCEGRCQAWAYAGDYWVDVRSSRNTLAGRREITLESSSRISVRARSRDETSPTGIVGLVLAPSGLALIGLSFWQAERERDDASQDEAQSDASITFQLGLLTLVGGLVCMIIGGAQTSNVPDVAVVTAE